MTHNPYLPCLNTPIDFPLSITASFCLKSTSVPMFSCILTQVTHKAVFVFHPKGNARLSVIGSYASSFSPLFLSTLPPLSLSHTRSNPRCGFLEDILV
ncbi:unnamed protein product [Hymenolepis diminuta]|uniref:Uncharacterized protein n=1 Tax=Hymenolepis diminuta TaxID=6216 RepID=A0A564Z6R6_HYMDI|nr:unnamed protein product [Hymenolepis diminuta]